MSMRAWSPAVAAVLVGAAAVGCSSGGAASVDGADGAGTMPVVHGLETTNITVYDYPSVDSSGLYIAENEGLFKAEGLKVTVVPDYKSSQDTVNTIESGKAQVSSGDYVTYMNDFVGKDSNLEIIGEGSILEPNVLALMAAPDSKIKNLTQLEGKAIPVSGVNDIATLLIDSVLNDNDVPIDSVHFVPGIALPAVPAMVAKGAFAAGPVPEPFVEMGEEQEGDTVLADLNQGATTNFPIQGYAVTREWAQENPNTLKAFVTALEEGQEIADTDRAELQKAIEGEPLKVAASIAAVISTPDFPVGIDPVRLQRVMDDMVEFGFFKGKTLAAAKAFKAANVVYTANLANADGTTPLLGG